MTEFIFNVFLFVWKYFHVHLCTWAFCTLCIQNHIHIRRHVKLRLECQSMAIAKQRCAAYSMAWYGMARHGMSWYWIAIFFASTFLRLIKFVKQNDTYDHGCTGTHIFSSLASALFHFSFILFFSPSIFLSIWPITLLYGANRKRICMFSTQAHAHTRTQYHRMIFEVALFLKWKENSIKDDQSLWNGRIKRVIFIFIKKVSTSHI